MSDPAMKTEKVQYTHSVLNDRSYTFFRLI